MQIWDVTSVNELIFSFIPKYSIYAYAAYPIKNPTKRWTVSYKQAEFVTTLHVEQHCFDMSQL